MKSPQACCATFLLLVLEASMAGAVEIEPLLKEHGCRTCHHDTKPNIGPAFKVMAARRCQDRSAALAGIKSKLHHGVGHPRSPLADDQLSQFVEWVCSIRQD